MLSTIHSLQIKTGGIKSDGKTDAADTEIVVNRDSYLHPMEEPATEDGDIQTKAPLENERYTSASDLLIPNRDSYLHPMGETNDAVVMEMKDLDVS